MLFVFPGETQTPFWMKNTPLSLDLIFIRKNSVVDIIANAVPFSESLLFPLASYDLVLEVINGTAQKAGFSRGQPVTYSFDVEKLRKD